MTFVDPHTKQPLSRDADGNLYCEVSGKRIVLPGNGTDGKELYFAALGANVVYTDLSIEAATFMQRLYSQSRIQGGSVEFDAVDAIHLPFPDASFDLIYGYAFVHHLENLSPFLAEVHRCLKIGGRCRFLDAAYSSIWQFSKRTFLHPLQKYVHRKRDASPEDLRATRRGGYRYEELAALMKKNQLILVWGFSK